MSYIYIYIFNLFFSYISLTFCFYYYSYFIILILLLLLYIYRATSAKKEWITLISFCISRKDQFHLNQKTKPKNKTKKQNEKTKKSNKNKSKHWMNQLIYLIFLLTCIYIYKLTLYIIIKAFLLFWKSVNQLKKKNKTPNSLYLFQDVIYFIYLIHIEWSELELLYSEYI